MHLNVIAPGTIYRDLERRGATDFGLLLLALVRVQ